MLQEGDVFSPVCLSVHGGGVPCDHYPRCIRPHGTGVPGLVPHLYRDSPHTGPLPGPKGYFVTLWMNVGWVMGDIQRWCGQSSSTCCNLICLHFLHWQALEVLKHPLTPSHAHSHRATWWIFHLLIFLLKYSFLSLQLVPLLAEDLINFDPPDGKIYIVALGNHIKHSATKFNNYSINSGMCEQ